MTSFLNLCALIVLSVAVNKDDVSLCEIWLEHMCLVGRCTGFPWNRDSVTTDSGLRPQPYLRTQLFGSLHLNARVYARELTSTIFLCKHNYLT